MLYVVLFKIIDIFVSVAHTRDKNAGADDDDNAQDKVNRPKGRDNVGNNRAQSLELVGNTCYDALYKAWEQGNESGAYKFKRYYDKGKSFGCLEQSECGLVAFVFEGVG